MARETKEQRAARFAREEQILAESEAKYKATIPARLLAAQALARSLGIQTEVTLTLTGPSVRFYDPDNAAWNETITYETEEWELISLENSLQEVKEQEDARILRRGIAEDVWNNKLTQPEKEALREFIHYLHI